MIIQISWHAQEKMDSEGISLEQIKRAIKMGSISRQTDGYLATYMYLKIAFKRKGDIYRIKTVFIDKR